MLCRVVLDKLPQFLYSEFVYLKSGDNDSFHLRDYYENSINQCMYAPEKVLGT